MAIAEARKNNIKIEDKLINSIAKLDNKSVIKISGSDTLRIVDTELLTDKAGQFKVKNTLTVNGNVFTAGAVQPQHLFSFENIDNSGDMKIVYSKEALEQISKSNEMGGSTKLTGSTLGSWVLVDAKTGKQMANPNNGHKGSIVCDLDTCGASGSFGKEASSFGGVYVLENLADPVTGNVAGRCASGDCQFNFDNNNTFGLFKDINQQSTQVTAETKKISAETKKSIEASRAVVAASSKVTEKALTGTKDVASNVVNKLESIAASGLGNNGRLQKTIQEINQSQAAAAAAAVSETANKITHAMSTQTASSAIAGALARDMVQGASNEVNTTSQQLREAKEAVASASTEAQKAAAEAQQATAQAAADAAREALNAAQEATKEIQQAARAAQEAAGDIVAGISGSDLEALRQLPNDALGVWQLVDSEGKAVNDQQIVCNISSCGAGAAWAAAEHAKGNYYVRTNRTGGY